MYDQVEHAVEIGRRNADFISLGKAWCTHLRADHGPLGVGMLEEMTGLPVTGGRLTCDFARQPVGLAGMELEVTALGFYEDNCIGCTDRAPGNRVPNLSTWAEPLLAERAEQERAQEDAQEAVLVERQRRVDLRTLVAGELSAASQEIVALINRIDLEPSDRDAEESLRGHARLAPDEFTDAVKSMLYTDTRVLRSSVLLEVLLAVDTPGSRLHELCLNAVREGWGRTEGCRYLCEHGLQRDLDDELLDGIVFHAAAEGRMMFDTPGEPAALLHYHSLDSGAVEDRVKVLLCHGYSWLRAAAAAASQVLVAASPACGERLLTALLDGLRHEDDMYDQDRPAAKIASVVAVVLQHIPGFVDAAVGRRWSRASPEYRARLINCYSSVVRRRTEPLPTEVGRIVAARAVSALSEPFDQASDGYGGDYQGRASDLLKEAVRLSPAEAIQSNAPIWLLLDWVDREHNLAEPDPADPLAPLHREAARARMGYIIWNILDAVVALGGLDPSASIAECSELYSGTEAAPSVRSEVVRVAGRVAAESGAINDALPLIYTAMLGDDQSVRAAGMEAAEAVMGAIPHESIPPLLAQAAVAGLTDDYLIVVRAAIKAVREVPADLIAHQVVAAMLLVAAGSYASDRYSDQMVQDALGAAHHLVLDDEPMLEYASTTALEIVKRMPAHSARKALWQHPWLEPHPSWDDAAIQAVRLDDNLQYEYPEDRNKDLLLEKLGRRSLATPQIETLAAGELVAGKHDRRRSFLAADLFSELGRPDLSARVIGAHLESVPDTIEKRSLRQSIEVPQLAYRFEEAVASRDPGTRDEILERVRNLCADSVSGVALPDPVEVIHTRHALIEALDAISDGSRDAGPIKSALAAYRTAAGELPEGDVVWAFAELVEALTHAVRWIDAAWSAQEDATRHATAARLRAGRVLTPIDDQWPSALREAAQQLATLDDYGVPAQVAACLGGIPMPLRLTELYRPTDQARSYGPQPAEVSTPGAAILIRHQGEPVMRPTIVQPYALHQFQVEARVTEWPDGADILEVTFLRVHPPEILYVSDARFTRDELTQPLEIRVAGHRPPEDAPLSLTAQASFVANSEPQAVRLVGNTTLEIITFDPDTALPLDMPTTALQLQQMMNEMANALPTLGAEVSRDARLLLEAVVRFAHTVLDDRLGQGDDIDEAWFQRQLQQFLQADHRIGARLRVHERRAGGVTDLVLGDIVLELKVEKDTAISLDTASARYASQATQYASADDCPVSMLAVLDVSPKRAPAGVMGNEMRWAYPETTSGQDPPFPSLVGVVVVRAGFPKPSDFSP